MIVASSICVIRMAQEQGMEAVMVFSSREAVVDAIKWAKDIVAIRKKDREKAEFLKTIIDHSYSGVIAVNKENVVTHFNPMAEEVFKVSGAEIVGKKVEDIPLSLIRDFFQNPETIQSEVQEIGGGQIIFNHSIIWIGSRWTVITFQSV